MANTYRGARDVCLIWSSGEKPNLHRTIRFFDTFIGNPELQPEQADSVEIGIRGRVAEDSVNFSLSYFQSRLEDEIDGFVFDPGTGAFTANNSAAQSDRQGVEASVDWNASTSTRIRATYTYLDATFDKNNIAGITEVRRPSHSGSVTLAYQFEAANMNLSAVYTGDQEDDFFPPYPPFQERVTLPGHLLVNFASSIELTKQVSAFATVDNLLNQEFEQVYGFVGPGRIASIGIRVRW